MEIYAKEMKRPKSLFRNIKLFVLCHGLLQLTQLLYSSYFKSTITTIERRFGLSSFSSGTISSLHEVSNTALIVFISYFGGRVHRPRFIGIGGLLMSVSAMILTLPHFLSEPYAYTSAINGDAGGDLCHVPLGNASSGVGVEQGSCGTEESSKQQANANNLWLLMASAQLLFGVGSVPIQPFGISYVDDFAGAGNSSLYIAILFSVSVFGPAFGYLLGSAMLSIYVDVDRADAVSYQELSTTDPRWVGAWWLGLVISSGCLALTSIPYFFFPRSMPVESNVIGTVIPMEQDKKEEMSLFDFLKMFPRLFVRLLLSPFFLLLILSQCCFSSVMAGLATFLNKFLERQYSASTAYSSLLIGALNLPSMAVGMLLGGVIMKKTGMSLKAIPRFAVAVLTLSFLVVLPLFFMGCPTQRVAEVNFNVGTNDSACYSQCGCPASDFNPVCGSDGVEYISPCRAGCRNYTLAPNSMHRIQVYTKCSCVSGVHGNARSGSCPNECPHLLLPVIFLLSLAGLIASLSHNPTYMMVLRTVPSEEKSFAIGVQFLFMRLLAWIPGPAIFGMTIDTSCIWWRKHVCGHKLGCGYYDNNTLRNRYLGLQLGFKAIGIALLAIVGWRVQRTREYSLDKKTEGPL
ncbi:solute carrier organic anion transporter family member 2A1 [Aplochiton taeniatus]